MHVIEAKHLIIMHQAPYKWDWDELPPQYLPEVAKLQEDSGLISETSMFFLSTNMRISNCSVYTGF